MKYEKSKEPSTFGKYLNNFNQQQLVKFKLQKTEELK